MKISGARKKKKRTNPILLVFMILFSFACIYPFFYILVLSFNDATDSLRGGIYFWPRKWSITNYKMVFRNKYLLNAFGVTVLRCVIMTVLVPLVCSLYAYALTMKKLPGRRFFSRLLLVPMYIGGGIIPFYMLLRELHLVNTFWVYIIPYCFSAYNVLLFRSYFIDISSSLRDSAIVDGANEAVVFFKIIFPVSIPVFAAIALFAAVGNWNEWMVGELFISKSELYTLPTILRQILRSSITNEVSGIGIKDLVEQSTNRVTTESLRYAMIVITTAPILAIYPFLQKYFVHGIMLGAVKE